MINNDIYLNPIGIVNADIDKPADMPLGGKLAQVEIFPEYQPALLRIEENSHIWLLLWFHQSNRQTLITRPAKVNPDLPEFGVFALRAFNRPNPIGLTLVKLERVEGNRLWVSGLDAINGTPVLDIKPYYESDRVFSPRTSYIRPHSRPMRMEHFHRHALSHHREECADLCLAVRMAVLADEYLGQLTADDVYITIQGSRCLADTIQGLTNARLANPPRLTFVETDSGNAASIWVRGQTTLTLTAKRNINQNDFWNLDDHEVLDITTEKKEA